MYVKSFIYIKCNPSVLYCSIIIMAVDLASRSGTNYLVIYASSECWEILLLWSFLAMNASCNDDKL